MGVFVVFLFAFFVCGDVFIPLLLTILFSVFLDLGVKDRNGF